MAVSKKKDAEPGMVGVRIPASLHRRVRIFAAKEAVKQWRVLGDAIEEYLKKRNA